MPIQNNTFPQSGDPDDATRLAQLIGHSIITDYVGSGLEIDVDFESESLTVSEGVFYTSSSQDEATSDGDTILDLGYVSQIEETTISIPNSGTYYVVADANVDTTNSPRITLESDLSDVAEYAIEIGEVSIDDQTVVETNRDAGIYDDIEKFSTDGDADSVPLSQGDGTLEMVSIDSLTASSDLVQRTVEEGESFEITEGNQLIVYEDYIIDGDSVDIDGELVIL